MKTMGRVRVDVNRMNDCAALLGEGKMDSPHGSFMQLIGDVTDTAFDPAIRIEQQKRGRDLATRSSRRL
jgi:hypothetical protein